MRCPDCGEIVLKNQTVCPNCNRSMQGEVFSDADEPRPAVMPVASRPSSTVQAEEPAPAVEPKRKTKHKKSYAALLVAFVIALIIVLLMIYFYQDNQKKAELRAYNNAMLSAEPAVMQNYLDMYMAASSAHRDSVKAHLDAVKKLELEWTNAAASKSKSILQQYIDRYPTNIHVPEARQLIDSIDWAAAVRTNTQDGYRHYMEEHGDDEHYDEARSAYDTLEEQRQAREKAVRDSIAAADTARVKPVAP